MAIYFLDSSAIVKHYQAEVGTAEVDRVLHEANSRHFIALLAVVEVQSAFVGFVAKFRWRRPDLSLCVIYAAKA